MELNKVWKEYKLFDSHAHIGSYSDIDRKANVTIIKQYMEKYNILHCALSCLSKNIRRDNDEVASAIRSMPDKLIGLAHIDPNLDDAADEVRRCISMGFKGIKLHPVMDAFFAFDVRIVAPVLEAASKNHLPVLIHTGTPPMTTPIHIGYLAQNFSDIPLICAHSGLADSTYEILSTLKIAENVYFDTALASTPPVLENLVAEGGGHRLLWASDIPYGNFISEFFRVYSLEIPEEQKRAIFYDNAAKLYKISQ